MFSLTGKYNKDCMVYTDVCDNGMIGQLTTLLNQESANGSKIRIMPDCHSGKGCVIGTTMTIKDKVIPGLVGQDIGCGMYVVKLKEKRVELPKLDSVIHKNIPSGFTIHDEAIATSNIDELICSKYCNLEKDYRGLGTLGGGNHFIELDKDEEGSLYLVIHTGSRHLGAEVCKFYQDKGYDLLKSNGSISYELAYVDGDNLINYLHDMDIVCNHAMINRETIAKVILKGMKLHEVESFHTIHNYIDTKHRILRKGAISAREGEKVIIPMNMRDGAVICVGKGNDEWNQSAPHGAGRLMSRAEAKESISMKEYKDTMKGIFTSCVSRATIDESPMAYKSINDIIPLIQDTVTVETIVKPIYNFKAGE